MQIWTELVVTGGGSPEHVGSTGPSNLINYPQRLPSGPLNLVTTLGVTIMRRAPLGVADDSGFPLRDPIGTVNSYPGIPVNSRCVIGPVGSGTSVRVSIDTVIASSESISIMHSHNTASPRQTLGPHLTLSYSVPFSCRRNVCCCSGIVPADIRGKFPSVLELSLIDLIPGLNSYSAVSVRDPRSLSKRQLK